MKHCKVKGCYSKTDIERLTIKNNRKVVIEKTDKSI